LKLFNVIGSIIGIVVVTFLFGFLIFV